MPDITDMKTVGIEKVTSRVSEHVTQMLEDAHPASRDSFGEVIMALFEMPLAYLIDCLRNKRKQL